MEYAPELLLVATVGVVGVLHTIVPDHGVPITLANVVGRALKRLAPRSSPEADM